MAKKIPKNTDGYIVNGSLVIPFPNAVKAIKEGLPMTIYIKENNKLIKRIKIN